MARDMLVGIISDTHALLRAEALAALRGSDIILHAGDIGRPEIIGELRRLAPTFVVRGNIDRGEWAAELPFTQLVVIAGCTFFVLHDISQLGAYPSAASAAAVVFGHSHVPSIKTRAGVLFLNPGSAGPRRFKLPITLARARVSNSGIHPELVQLLPG
jgi:putative phosphoesterase